METALTALIWGATIIVYCVAAFAIFVVGGVIAVFLYIIGLAIHDWWRGKAWEARIREAKKKGKGA